jgi:hypothetical protein
MGLDMYLERMPRYRGATAKEISSVGSYLSWQEAKEKGSPYADCTFEDWCGIKKTPPKAYINFYSKFYESGCIMEEVGYWRKANQIHNWFVENIQDGIDDCTYHREVTEEDLEELLDVCKRVYNSIAVGEQIIAKELLPTRQGFFFGDIDYDEYYVQDIEHTIDIITEVLETTDFETQMIYYCSSW